MNEIRVRSNVRRDLLQSAQLFKNEKLVVWEYVANSLQYVDAGITPVVEVTIETRAKRLRIQDNGRGMNLDGLQNFFVMHGENRDRLAGKGGRGRFGTGKSAAFGIGRSLRVTSVCGGKRSVVELTRASIDASGDDEIPLAVLEAEQPVSTQNGTLIEVSEIQLKRLDPMSVVRYIERHLSRWGGRPLVTVNGHVCEPHEPPVARIKTCIPDESVAKVIGAGRLLLKVSSIPLDSEQQGVAVFASGVWLASTLAGIEGQPFANYIFGEIDVPSLDDEDEDIPAFDMTRSLQLNPENPVVQTLLPYLGREIDQLRRELVREDKERRSVEESRKLQREADLIADIINSDFKEFSDRLQRVNARTGKGRDRASSPKNDELDGLLVEASDGTSSGDDLAASGQGDGGGGNQGEAGATSGLLEASESGQKHGNPASGSRQRKGKGGFSVEFKGLGEAEPRASYVREERVIFVNLDHPQIKAARGNESIESITFRRVAYEVAFCEYAIALAQELAANGEFMDPTDPIFEIRETLNRMATCSAQLYASS